MKELLKHLPAIKGFIEERTTAFQEISDNVLKNFLKEAYKLPFLFPVRIIVNEDKFVNFLFDMRKDLFEGKKLDIVDDLEKKDEVKEKDIVASKEVVVEVQEKKPVVKKEVAKTVATKTKTKSNVVAKDTKVATNNKKTTVAKNTKSTTKKEKLVS
jgi:hypothetical protein